MSAIDSTKQVRKLVIDLTRSVDSNGLTQALRNIPIVPKNSEKLTSELHFQPAATVTRIELITNRVNYFTAEAAAQALALESWLRNTSQDIEFHSDLTETISRLSKSTHPRHDDFQLYVEKLPLPVVGASDSISVQIATQIAESAFLCCRRAAKQLKIGTNQRLLGWAHEVVLEALLNAAEHSQNTDSLSQWQSEVFVAFAVAPGHSDNNNRPSDSEDASSTLHSNAGLWLEVAIADNGCGIPQTLTPAFLAHEAEMGRRPARERTALHAEILKWALTPFGTSKAKEAFASEQQLKSWRGLYRALYRTMRLQGSISIASGYARLTINGADESTWLNTHESTKGMPWTSLSAAAPLNVLGVIPSSKAGESDLQSIAFGNDSIGTVSVAAPDADIDKNQIVAYRDAVTRTARRLIRESKHHPKIDGISIYGIVHPAPRFSTATELLPTNALGSDSREMKLDQAILEVMIPLMFPGCAFVHFFLDLQLDREKLEELRVAIQTLVIQTPMHFRPTIYGVQGIFLASEDRIFWLNSAEEAKSEEAGAARTTEQLLWRTYSAATGAADLLSKLPSRVDRSSVRIALNSLIESITSPTSAIAPAVRKWYWTSERRSGAATSGIQISSSDRVASAYMNANALCDAIPSVFHILKHDFFHFVSKLSSQTHSEILVISDTEVASHFLMRKLEEEWRRAETSLGTIRNGLRFEMAADLIPIEIPGSAVIIFSDFALTGSSILHRIQLVEQLTGLRRQSGIHLYVFCLGGTLTSAIGQLKQAPQILLERQIETVPITNQTSIQLLSIDPVTCHLISHHQTQELALLKSTNWAGNEDEASTLKTFGAFEYGLRHISGRVFTCRWPVAANLQIPAILRTVALRLLALLGKLQAAKPDAVVLVVRDDSTLRACIPALLNAILERSASAPNVRLDIVRIGVLTLRKGLQRRLTAYALRDAIASSVHLTGSMQLFEEDELPILQANRQQPKRSGLMREEPGRAPANVSLLLLDNATVTGRTLQEFCSSAIALHEDDTLALQSLACFSLVSRLSPVEESLIRRTAFGLSNGDGTANVRLRYEALIQLRVRSYRDTASIPATAMLLSAANAAMHDGDPAMADIRKSYRTTVGKLAQPSDSGAPLKWLLGESVDRPTSYAPSDAIVGFRQLLSLQQQGVQCTIEIIKTFRELVRNEGVGVLIVFALEPELIAQDTLLLQLSMEIRHLSLSVLGSEADIGICLLALWVCTCLPHDVSLALPRLLSNKVNQEVLLKHYVFLIVYSMPANRRGEVIKRSIQVLAKQSLEVPWVGKAWEILSGAETQEAIVRGDESDEQARFAIEHLIAKSRRGHGQTGFGAWRRIQQWMIGRSQSPAKVRAGSFHESIELSFISESTSWLRSGYLPAARACIRLLQRTRHINHSRLQSSIVSLPRLHAAFLKGANPTTNLASDDDIARAWDAVEKSSSRLAVDEVFSSPARYKQLFAPGLSAVGDGSRLTDFDLALCQVICEPCFLVLGAVLKNIAHGYPLKYMHCSDEGEPVVTPGELVFDLASEGVLKFRWFERNRISLVWLEAIPRVNEALNLVLENVARYAQLSAGISIQTIERAGVSDKLQGSLEVIITNSVAVGKESGNGLGSKRIQGCMQAIGGIYRYKLVGRMTFETRLQFPVQKFFLSQD